MTGLLALVVDHAGHAEAIAGSLLKKFEHVAEVARLADLKEQAKRESAAMDEMGLRKATGR